MFLVRQPRSLAHPQVLPDAGDPPLDKADVRRRGTELRVGDQLGLDELDDPTACLDRAGSAGEDVLHPLHVRPIGQEEEVVRASADDVDRRVVGASGAAAAVRQDGEAGKVLRERSGDRIDVAVHDVTEPPHPSPVVRLIVASTHSGLKIRA
jgi:hypothetical protein